MIKKFFFNIVTILLMALVSLITITPIPQSRAAVEPEVKSETVDKFFQIVDLPLGAADYFYIYSIYQNEIVGLYPDGLYRGDWKITRGQLAIWIAKIINLPIYSGCYGMFKDVSADPSDPNNYGWACQYIEAVASAGIMTGYAGDYFSPGSNVSFSALQDIISRARLGQPTQVPPNYSDTVGTFISRSQLAAYLSWNFNTPIYLHFSGKLKSSADKTSDPKLNGSKVEIKIEPGPNLGGGQATIDSTSGDVKYDFALNIPIQDFLENLKDESFGYLVTPPSDSGFKSGINTWGALSQINYSNGEVYVKRADRKISGEIVFPPGCEAEANSCIDVINQYLSIMGSEPLPSTDVYAAVATGLDSETIKAAVLGSSGLTEVGEGKITWNPSTRKLTYEIQIKEPPTEQKTYSLFRVAASGEQIWLFGEVTFSAGQSEATNVPVIARSTISILKIIVVDKVTGQPVPNVSVTLPGTSSDLRSKGFYNGLTDASGAALLAESTIPLENFPKNIVINIYPPAYTGFSPRTNYPIGLSGCVAQNIIVELY